MRVTKQKGMPTQRQLKVGEEVRHALVDVMIRGEVHDPDLLKRSISILEVRMSPDLRKATVLIMPLGGREEKEALVALNRNIRELRWSASQRLRNLKFSPDLIFRIDDRYGEAERIEKIFHEDRVRRDLVSNDVTSDENEA